MALSQCVDHVSEGGERLVDGRALLQLLGVGAQIGPLRSREVNKVDLGREVADGAIALGERLAQHDREDGVRSRRALVHARGGDGTRLVALRKELLDLLVRAHLHLCQVLDVDAAAHVLTDLQAAIALREQIRNHFIVELGVRRGDLEAGAGRCVGHALEQLHRQTRHDAEVVRRAHDRMRFAAAGLAVCEDGAIVALKGGGEDLGADIIINLWLRRIGPV